jgi:transcriptional regulator with XRE-family HTH domain
MVTPASPKPPGRSMRASRVTRQKSGWRVRAEASQIREFRDVLKLSRPLFARLMGCSERTLANWESGRHLPDIYKSRLNELQRLYIELSESVDPQIVGSWIITPNEEFDGLKPLELIERGETFRIWRMIFLLKIGNPS